MTRENILKNLFILNEVELFYKEYFEKKKNKDEFNAFISKLNVDECFEKHLIIPEIKSLMPQSMKDEYFISTRKDLMLAQKHNCYSPSFLHYHTYFECIYVYEGTCYNTINNEETKLNVGDFIIIPPGLSHSISVNDESVVINLIVSMEAMSNAFNNPTYNKGNKLSNFFIENINYSNNNSYLTIKTGNDEEIKSLIVDMIFESYNKYSEYSEVLYAYFSILFAKMVRHYEGTITENGDRNLKKSLVYEMVMFTKEHIDTITLETLSQKYNYSCEYISRLIKESTKMSFSEIVLTEKMKKASTMLLTGNLSIEQISFACGYANPESFIRTFKKYFKTTPTKYRIKNI